MKQTLFIKVDSENPDLIDIQTAANILRKGGLVAFPTETVYGLGADALNPTAVSGLFEAKMRPLDNPPIIHVSDPEDVYKLVKVVPPKAKVLMKKFWPGPLTLIFECSSRIPKVTVAGLDTIAIRIPNNKVAQSLIKQSDRPIAAPSANLAGKPSPTTAQHVYEDLNGRIDAILDSGSTNIGVESTVVDVSVDPPMILRPGGTPFEAIKKVLRDVTLHPFVLAEQEMRLQETRSPGMKYKHYAPKAEVILIEGSVAEIIAEIKKLTESFSLKGLKVGILATDETQNNYEANVVKSLGSRFYISAIAKNLFRLLREVDAEGVDVILTESVPPEGLGLAVMNRLRKASGYNIIKPE